MLSQHELGVAFLSAKRHDDAIRLLEIAAQNRLKILGPNHRSSGLSIDALTRVYETTGRYALAIELLLPIVKIAEGPAV